MLPPSKEGTKVSITIIFANCLLNLAFLLTEGSHRISGKGCGLVETRYPKTESAFMYKPYELANLPKSQA